MSWRDDFNDGSLDTTKFGTSVAGDGAVAEAGGTVNITMGAVATNAALTYVKDEIVSNVDYVYRIRHKLDGSINSGANIHLFTIVNGIPVCATNANFWNTFDIACRYVDAGYLSLVYKNSAGTYYYWNGSAWTSTGSPTAYTGLKQTSFFDIAFIVRNGKWRFSISINGHTKSIVETDWVAFSSLYAYTHLYAFWGDPITDYHYVTSMKTDWLSFSNETIQWGFYNGSNDFTTYYIGRVLSFDGGITFFRDPITVLISPLAGENCVKNPYVVEVGGIQYLFYLARITATGYWRTRLATSTDYFETKTDQGYAAQEGAGGSWNAKGTMFTTVFYVSGQGWFAYATGMNASDIGTIGLYTASNPLDTWIPYGSNPILSLPAWANLMIFAQDILYESGTVKLWINGYDSTILRWKLGLYTITPNAWETLNADGGNPLSYPPSSKTTTLSAQANAAAIQLTVTSSSNFTAGDPIGIGGATKELNRVDTVPDGTHINLIYPLTVTHANGSRVSVFDYGDPGMSEIRESFAFGVLIHLTGTSSDFEVAGYFIKSGNTFLLDSAKTPILPIGPSWDTISVENLKWVQAEITLTPEIQGDIALSLSPGSTSIVEYICQGAVSLTLTPQAATIADYVFSGTVLLDLLPNSEYAQTVFVVQGNISVSLSPQSIPIADYPFQGDLSLSLTPNTAYVWEKIVQGAVDFILLPSAIMQIDIPILIQGDIDISFLLAALIEYLSPDFSYETLTEKTFPSPSGIYDFEIETTKTFPAPDGIYPFKPEMVN